MAFAAPSRRARRRGAAAMVMLWLFMLVAGVANACMLKDTGAHSHAEAVDAATTSVSVQTVDITAGHLGLVPAHDADDARQSSPPCLKACDESTRALPTDLNDQLDPGGACIVGMVKVTMPVAQAASGPGGGAHALAPTGPPARLLFSRLTL